MSKRLTTSQLAKKLRKDGYDEEADALDASTGKTPEQALHSTMRGMLSRDDSAWDEAAKAAEEEEE